MNGEESIFGAEVLISNKSSFGKTEFDIMKEIYNGICELIDGEKAEVDAVEDDENHIEAAETVDSGQKSEEDDAQKNSKNQDQDINNEEVNAEEGKTEDQMTKMESVEEAVTFTEESVETKTTTESELVKSDDEENLTFTKESPSSPENSVNGDERDDGTEKQAEEIPAEVSDELEKNDPGALGIALHQGDANRAQQPSEPETIE